MNTINIEKIACSAVGKYLSDCCVLVPNIDENDKTPIWDGDIYIHVAVSFYMSVQDHDNVKLHVDEGNDVLRIIHQLSAENQQ